MPDVLTAEQVQAILETPLDEQPLMIAEDPSVLAALARSHEALRSERDAAVEKRSLKELIDGMAKPVVSEYIARIEASARAAGSATDALRQIVWYYESPVYKPVIAYQLAQIAREALAVLDHATPAAADEERQA